MALEWLKIEVPLGAQGSGLAEGTDPHHLPPARLVRAENVETSQLGRFDKRRGTTARNALASTDTIVATPSQTLEVSSIDDAFHGFQHMGWIPRWNVTTSTVTMRQDLNVRSMDVAAYEDDARRLLVYVYEADEKIFAAIKDLENNTWKYHDREVVANARKPRAIRVGSYVVITYITNDDDELWALHYIPVLDSFSAPLAKLNDNMESYANYDIARYDDDSFVLAVAPFYDTPYATILAAQDFSTIQTPLAFTAETYVSAVSVAVHDETKKVALTWYESANEEVPTAVYTRALSLHFGQSPDRLIRWACTDP